MDGIENEFPREPAFPKVEYDERLARVRKAMRGAEFDIVLVHGLPGICYLSGFQTPLSDWYHCLVVPLEGDPILQVCDPELAKMHTYIETIVPVLWERMDEAPKQLSGLLKGLRASSARIGVEMRRPGLNPETLDHLRSALPTASFEDATDLLLKVRSIKTSAEISCLREAAKLSVVGMTAAIAAVRAGATENSICGAAMQAMVGAGSEYFCIDPIVRAGRRSGITHATPKRATIRQGESIFIELGGVYQRYCAPVLRTVVLGEPSAELQRMSELSLRAIDAIIDRIRPGLTMGDVARKAQAVLTNLEPTIQTRGYFGYSIGVGFPPSWVERSIEIAEGRSDIFQPGMTFHAHRSMRLSGEIGVGFSETLLVTETGCEALTQFPRQLISV